MVEQAKSLAVSMAPGSYNQYPAPVAKYEEVVADRQLFMTSLEKLHSVMGTKFMIPIIGGRDLDLHKLFVEVTSRGGIEELNQSMNTNRHIMTFPFPTQPKTYYSLVLDYNGIKENEFFVLLTQGKAALMEALRHSGNVICRNLVLRQYQILREKRWKEVTLTFNFPSTATNASFVLRKYYYSLLQHYEQIYYFKVQAWRIPSSTEALQGSNEAPVAVHEMPKITSAPAPAQAQAPNIVNAEQPTQNTIQFVSGGSAASSVGTPILGVIDGKFDGGYLVTVRFGKDTLKGVLYQVPPTQVINQVQQPSNLSTGNINNTPKSGKRKRRKKSELRKRDPSHPKPNRSGYNFFVAEQHARLKLLHPGKDREISRKIGELWGNLQDNEKAVYQEKAVKDKERYMMEMEDYKEKLNENEVISDAVPLRQRFPCFSINMIDNNVKDGTQTDFSVIQENDSDSSKSETEDDDMIPVKDDELFSDTETSQAVDVKTGNAGIISEDFQIVQEDEKSDEESDVSFGDADHVSGETKQDSPTEPEL